MISHNSILTTRTLRCLACFFLLLTAVTVAHASDNTASAPSFTARDINNRLVSTDSLIARGPLIIDFWATWCGPCMEEFKSLKKLVETFGNDKLTVLAVSEDGPAETTKVKQLVRLKKWPFIVVIDKGKSIAQKYHISALPGLFLVGTDGKIHASARGFIPGDEQKLEEVIRGLLEAEKN